MPNTPEDESQRALELCGKTLRGMRERVRELIAERDAMYLMVDRLRGQLQNCVNHLHRAKEREPRGTSRDIFDACIDSANKTLYETLEPANRIRAAVDGEVEKS